MNEALKIFTTRTSVKAYKPEMPPQELIDDIITAGTCAPTGMNRQSPIIIEVTDKAVRDKLSGLNAAVIGANIDPFYGAPARPWFSLCSRTRALALTSTTEALSWAICLMPRMPQDLARAGYTAQRKFSRRRRERKFSQSLG